MLFFRYQQLHKTIEALPRFDDVGFRVYSQTDEDGVLLYIFSLIGSTNKICVEVAFKLPEGANTTNLICNWGWTGFLIEGNEHHIKQSREFFESHNDTTIYPPKLIQEWVTAENINGLLQENGVAGEIDLFSIDIDGVDYWIWKSLNIIRPRVVIVEYQSIWGADTSVTVPYRPDFTRDDETFFGASLAAFVKLGREKGYRLVGCNKFGFNAFFIREDIGENVLPEVSVDRCLQHLKIRDQQRMFLSDAVKREWEEV